MTLRIVDTRRKAELLSLRWIEGTLRVDRGSQRRQAHSSQESKTMAFKDGSTLSLH